MTKSRISTVLGLASSLLLAGADAVAGDFIKPFVFARASGSTCVDVSWFPADGPGFSGTHNFLLTRESPLWQQVFSAEQEPYYRDCGFQGLEPDTPYRYQVCASYITEDPDNTECSEWSNVARTDKPQQPNERPPPPTPHIVSAELGDTWIGIKWDAGYDYDSYFLNTNENITEGLPRNTRTIHHDDDGTWGYQRVEGLLPAHAYYFEVQGCTTSLLGILDDNCWGWSAVFKASTLPQPDPRICVSGFVWREASPDDLVCVSPEERDVNIPNDDQGHGSRSKRSFAPGSCPLINPHARKCFVTECIPPNVWRATPGDRICISPERAAQVEADNAAAASRRIGH